MMISSRQLEEMSPLELEVLYAELYMVNLQFHTMGIPNIKHKFLRDHLQEAMDPVKELMAQIDKIVEKRRESI